MYPSYYLPIILHVDAQSYSLNIVRLIVFPQAIPPSQSLNGLSCPFLDFDQPFNGVSYPFLDFGQPFNGLSYPFLDFGQPFNASS